MRASCETLNGIRAVAVASALFSSQLYVPNAIAADIEPVRGVIRAALQADVSTDLDVPVARVTVRPGDRFAKGDVLVAFDCARYRGALRSANATRTEMHLNVQSNEVLAKRGAGGFIDLEVSRARLEKAQGEIEILEAKMRECVLRAPFSGRVIDVLTRPFERPSVAKPFITILGDDALEIELIVPSTWLRWLKPDSAFEFLVDETGGRHPARVVRLGAKVDPVSQTIEVTAVFAARPENVLVGMSGTARFAMQPEG